MWKTIGYFFSRSGKSDDDAKLRQLWISLVRFGTARGLMLQDAEDLAQESIVAGVHSFDPTRGDFGALCRTIMSNKAKNFHRDRRSQVPMPDDGGRFVDPGDGPAWTNYYRQCRERSDRIIAEALSLMDEETAHFFLVLADVYNDQSHGEVSEAARRAGISPQKGWDIFRKIQRRFGDLDRAVLVPERPPAQADVGVCAMSIVGPGTRLPMKSFLNPSSPPPPSSDILFTEGGFMGHFRGQYHSFWARLGESSRRELREIFKH